MKNGKGRYRFSDGENYDGEWRNDTMHGSGTYTYAEGKKLYGEWRNSRFVSASQPEKP